MYVLSVQKFWSITEFWYKKLVKTDLRYMSVILVFGKGEVLVTSPFCRMFINGMQVHRLSSIWKQLLF